MTRPNQAAAVPANAAGSPKTKRRFWTAAEDECLRLWYAGVETDLICQVLGRKAGQVRQRAGALGLKKSIELRAKLVSQAMAKPGHPGRQCQFKAGTKPWNTGLTV